jgi:hypothetical protein
VACAQHFQTQWATDAAAAQHQKRSKTGQRVQGVAWACTGIAGVKERHSIEAVGDARVMRFTNLPAVTNSLTYKRIVVERGGKLYFGFRDKLRVDNDVRPNKEAMDALFAQLGLTR